MTDKNSLLSIRLADTLMQRYPHADNYPYTSWCYPQGFMLTGMIRLFRDTGNAAYREYALGFAAHHVGPDGGLYRFKGESMDDMMAGAIIAWAWAETGEERYRKACGHILAAFQGYPRTSRGGFWHSAKHTPGEMWVDGVFMGGMFLLAHAQYVGEGACCRQEVIRQLDCIYQCCHKRGGLLYHAWSEGEGTVWANPQTGLSPEVWSEGLGWYALILTETVRALPQEHPDRARLSARLEELLQTLCTLQNAQDGLWLQVVDRPDREDNWTDTSGSAMFIYALSQAPAAPQRRGRFEQAARRGMEGLRRRAQPDAHGQVDILQACDGLCVQKSYEDYVRYPRCRNAKEAVAAVLWAAESLERPLLRGKGGAGVPPCEDSK